MRLLACCCFLLQLLAAVQARRLFAQSGYISCRWSTKGFCDKLTPVCVQIGTVAPFTCMHYKNECQFLLDRCLKRTDFADGRRVNFRPSCAAIDQGSSGAC